MEPKSKKVQENVERQQIKEEQFLKLARGMKYC